MPQMNRCFEVTLGRSFHPTPYQFMT